MSQLNSAEDIVLDEDQTAGGAPAPAAAPVPRDVPTQKQKTNIYTVMLIISFICIVTACILLYWELTLWGGYPWWATDDGQPVSWFAPLRGIEKLV